MQLSARDRSASVRSAIGDVPPGDGAERTAAPRGWAWILCAAAALLFVGLGSLDFTDLDEGFYASISANMARTLDWITPRFNGMPWWEKPPLLYWMMAASFRCFGLHEWAGRLPSAVALLLTVAVTVWFARRWFGTRAAFFSGLFLTTSLLFLVQSQLATTDGLLTALLTAMFISVWQYARTGQARWFALAAGAAGFATLTKGPVALVFFIGISALVLAFDASARPQMRQWRSWAVAAMIYAIVVLPWYGAVLQAYGREFLVRFLYEQNIGRALGGDAAHNLPVYATAGFVLLGFFPWSAYLVPAALRRTKEPCARFLWMWLLLVFGFFSLTKAKLPAYTLPLYPAAAILVGHMWAEPGGATVAMRRTAAALIGLVFALIAFVALGDLHLDRVVFESQVPIVRLLLVGCLAAGAAGQLVLVWRSRRDSRTSSALVTAGMMAAIWLVVIAFAPSYNARAWRPVHSMAELARANGATLVAFDLHPSFPSLQFYYGAPFEAADTPDQLAALRSSGAPTYVILKSKDLSRLEHQRLRLLRASEQWSLVELL